MAHQAAAPSAATGGGDWTDLLRLRDRANGQEKQSYSPTDPSLALRMLSERVLPRGQIESWDRLDHQARAHASELREFGNRWAVDN